ncbi:hypothetical protein PRUPE_3G209400 [Prunus persica]|uniref:Uncharacterized protein n=1 Tax=Prunus persica TaxID=3760 RepID=A0A251Q3C8_PRUPE|nr:hypothetical protein PRUPE_3G209400 [Prunus persica]
MANPRRSLSKSSQDHFLKIQAFHLQATRLCIVKAYTCILKMKNAIAKTSKRKRKIHHHLCNPCNTVVGD